MSEIRFVICACLCVAGIITVLSSVFGVFRSASAAKQAYRKLAQAYKTIFICHTQHDSLRIVQE